MLEAVHYSNALSLTQRTPFGVLWTRLQPRVVGGANRSARAAARAFLQPGSTSDAFSTPGSAKPPESPQTGVGIARTHPKSALKPLFFPDAFPLPTLLEGVADADDLPDRLASAPSRPRALLCDPSSYRAKVAAPAGSMIHTVQAATASPEAERKGGQEGTIPPLSLPPRLNCRPNGKSVATQRRAAAEMKNWHRSEIRLSKFTLINKVNQSDHQLNQSKPTAFY